MSVPRVCDVERTVVGRYYMVPCVRLSRADIHPARDAAGWIPVIGPEHHDREVIGFAAMHFHIDVRFLGEQMIRACYTPFRPGTWADQVLGFPVSTHSDGRGGYAPIQYEQSLRRKRCQREMPAFPSKYGETNYTPRWMAQLEAEHRDCKLKPGLICPHRGIPLAQFVQDDGTVICPGHGLRWNARTGALIVGSQQEAACAA